MACEASAFARVSFPSAERAFPTAPSPMGEEKAANPFLRADVPEVASPAPLAQVLAEAPPGFRKLLFFEGGGEPLAQAVDRSADGHLILVGPEGGFAPREVEAALAAGARLTTLGPRILRFETAAIVSAALVQHLAGDLG